MAERYSDFIWDYYGGRPFRHSYPGTLAGPAAWMRASELAGKNRRSGDVGGLWDDNRETGRDMEYFQAMYPERMKRLQMKVGDLCDTIDYEGSILYDEYPDRIGLRKLCDELYRTEITEDTDEREAEWLRAAIEVLLYHEVCRRRVHRRCLKRKYW